MGVPDKPFTVRLPDDLQREIKLTAESMRLSKSDITRMVLARGLKPLRKQCAFLYRDVRQARTA